MKKLLKKKVNVFGKGVPVLAIFVLGLALVSAALVGYISNTVTGNVTVDSPMVAGISLGPEDGSWSTTQCLNTLETDPKYNTMVDCFPEGVGSDNTTVIKGWEESNWSETISLDDMYTGQEKTFTLYIMSANVAPDTEIKGYEEFIVESPGITCGDFESIKSRYDSIYGGLGYGAENVWISGDSGCTEGTGYIKFDSTESTWGAGETDVAEMVVTFNNVIGTYTFTYRVIPTA